MIRETQRYPYAKGVKQEVDLKSLSDCINLLAWFNSHDAAVEDLRWNPTSAQDDNPPLSFRFPTSCTLCMYVFSIKWWSCQCSSWLACCDAVIVGYCSNCEKWGMSAPMVGTSSMEIITTRVVLRLRYRLCGLDVLFVLWCSRSWFRERCKECGVRKLETLPKIASFLLSARHPIVNRIYCWISPRSTDDQALHQ